MLALAFPSPTASIVDYCLLVLPVACAHRILIQTSKQEQEQRTRHTRHPHHSLPGTKASSTATSILGHAATLLLPLAGQPQHS
jgi:hypothetical protein